jgi:hypothetical protein
VVGQLSESDLVELRRLVDAYADAVDRLDEQGFPALFAASGSLVVQSDDGPVEDQWNGADVVGSFELLRPYDRTFHHVGGALFEPSDDGASGRVTCLAHHYQKTANGPVDLVMMIRYHDHYSREDTGWRFARRRVAIQWTELHPAHPRRRRPR